MRRHVREHYGQLLRRFRDKTAADGPPTQDVWAGLKNAQELFADDPEEFAALSHPGGEDGLLRAFCAARGINGVPAGRARALLLEEIWKGHKAFISGAIEHAKEFDSVVLEQGQNTTPQRNFEQPSANKAVAEVRPFSDVVGRYFDELERTSALVAKTEADKRDALALLSELTGAKPLSEPTRTDAQEVKAALFKLPKNRSKNPKTRLLSLSEMLEVPDVDRIAPRTMNVYLGHMQSLFTWAVNNRYASENIFSGLKIRNNVRATDAGRRAFSAEQLRLMFSHLTDPNSTLVRKGIHKWPALIGMFTGMRLNEVAQLEVHDIELRDGVWCFNVTPDGEDNKRLKNASSKRRVPLHDKLIECGFLTFHDDQKALGHSRLFPELSYSPQNGYGRNAGRWFNERFLPELGMGGQGLVFHCLRHTMVTRLAHSGVEEPLLKALIGHSQTGVTFSTYFREGFLPAQLRGAINRFDF